MTTSANTAWISDLNDNGIRADLARLAADGVLSYNDALQILTDTGSDHAFTLTEFQTLQTVARHLNNGVAASSYVADIFTQLVLGNPANIGWHGGEGYSYPLGNLSGFSSVTQLNELIGKWFLGTDLPDPVLLSNLTSGGSTPKYTTASDALYGHTGAAAIVDVAQGAVGDCVVCAGMIEMVNNHPDLLKSMFVDNGNGTYGVRFYLDGNEVWVTVDRELPVNRYGDLLYAHNGTLQDKALWAPLLEKAYVQLSETGKVGHPSVNGYANIDGNMGTIVLPALTNTRASYYHTSDSDWLGRKAMLIQALAEHRDVMLETASTGAVTHDSDGMTELVASHAFAVLGYDDATGKFIVRNPWGDSYPRQDWKAQFELSMEEMAAEGGGVAVAAALGAPTIQPAATSHELGLSATVAVAPLFSVFNPDALTVSRYLFHAAGSGRLNLNGATNLATAEQQAAGDVVIGAADLAKLQFAAPTAAGTGSLSIQALLGQQWSASAAIDWSFDASNASAIVLPHAHNTVATGASIALASLFQLDGTSAASTYYEVIVPTGSAGFIELNGARNLWTTARPGEYEFNAADMARVSYRAPYTATTIKLQVNAYQGGGWGTTQDVTIGVGLPDVAHALQNYANGQFAAITGVSDCAANIFGQLDSLRPLLRDGWLGAIHVTDGTPQVQAMTGLQYSQYKGLLAVMDGNWRVNLAGAAAGDAALLATAQLTHVASLTVTASGADVSANLDALQTLAAAGKLTAITVTDGTTHPFAVTRTQMAADGDALRLVAGGYHLTKGADLATVLAIDADASSAKPASYDVADSAANIGAGLDALQMLAAAGKLGSVTLTDGAGAVVTVSAAQLHDDALALSKLSGGCTLAVTGASVADVATLAASHPNARFAVSDSADQLSAHLSVLRLQAAQGKLASVVLTDADTPALHLSAADLVTNASVLRAITSPYTVSVPGLSDGVARFVIQQDGAARSAETLMRPVADGAAAPHTGNVVVGFQNATLGEGNHAVVLEGARDHYAIRSDASGKLEIANVAASDADYGKHVTITGADYVIFNGAAATDAGFYPDMYFVVNGHNAAVAELYMAALGRLPRLTGLEFWESQLAAGASLADIAAGFIGSAEFTSRYPAAATPSDHGGAGDLAFVNALYQNVLHRTPKAAGLAFWVHDLAQGDSRANVLVAFAVSPEDETNTHAAPGHSGGWLIDSAKGGYADPALLLDAATVLRQGLANGYLNTGLIDASTIGAGVTLGGETLKGDTLTLAATLAPQSIVLSDAVKHAVVNGGGQQIYSAGHATIEIHGAGAGVHAAAGDQLDLLGGSDTTVTGFVAGSGATLHLATGVPALLDASASRVAGTALTFDASHGYVIKVGSLGDGSAAAVATAINRAYAVADTLAEHATFIGQDAGGNTQAWLFGTGSGAADHNGNHLADAGELLHLATLVGVPSAQLTLADLA
ncbi:DUF4214 domain-containing protein [Rugamonas apoptosis]|uniref:DUF4214 domain-containing protein n=1 Tax=Rugamonas apoptosis TaxID=2758570 RepID=A0A7W2F991_9BURK|nr:DUF4214 domain-containing protein [Rugamonas apoptosis]MBA5687425.1 DUF4214 domain-containing protein [Rugamonas apoptosis]